MKIRMVAEFDLDSAQLHLELISYPWATLRIILGKPRLDCPYRSERKWERNTKLNSSFSNIQHLTRDASQNIDPYMGCCRLHSEVDRYDYVKLTTKCWWLSNSRGDAES